MGARRNNKVVVPAASRPTLAPPISCWVQTLQGRKDGAPTFSVDREVKQTRGHGNVGPPAGVRTAKACCQQLLKFRALRYTLEPILTGHLEVPR